MGQFVQCYNTVDGSTKSGSGHEMNVLCAWINTISPPNWSTLTLDNDQLRCMSAT